MRELAKRGAEPRIQPELIYQLEKAHDGDEEGEVGGVEADTA
jgi:hypothetical protein